MQYLVQQPGTILTQKLLGNRTHARNAYRGLIEVPTPDIPFNLHERLSFALGSWHLRDKRGWRPEDAVHAIRESHKKGYPLMHGRRPKDLSVALAKEYDACNPFEDRTLTARLASIDATVFEHLLEDCGARPRVYVDDRQYGWLASTKGEMWVREKSIFRRASEEPEDPARAIASKLMWGYPESYALPDGFSRS